MVASPPAPRSRLRRLSWPGGLSARLLILTASFVLIAELCIVLPSLASYQNGWLIDRVRAAELASLAVDVAPAGRVSDQLSKELLRGAGVVSVAVQVDRVRRLLLAAPRMQQAPELIDLRRQNPADYLAEPFSVLAHGGPRMLRVVAKPQFRNGDFVEIVVPEAPLRADLGRYLARLLLVSVFISLLAGISVYVLLAALLVRPIRRITLSMERFRARPDDPEARLALSGRRDEIGRAEAELNSMQEELLTALKSRARLAALGEAVAKINHDLRNMLTSAQMASERLSASADPKVAQALPRLERALDRAVKLAQDVLAYGRTEEAAPDARLVDLATAAEAAAEDAGLSPGGVRLMLKAPARFRVFADPEQLHRILVNLFRNAREAIEGTRPGGKGQVALTAGREGNSTRLALADDGPGVPERVRARLFQPFAGSARAEGTGLGLAISRELARGHGGDLVLADTGPEGTTFVLTLPAEA